MQKNFRPFILLTSLIILFIFSSCGVQTLPATDQSANGTSLGDNDSANIMVGTGSGTIPNLPAISNSTLTELYEEGRGTLNKVGSKLTTLAGTVSYYGALTNTASNAQGVFFQGDTMLVTSSLQVRIFISQETGAQVLANGLTALENQASSRIVNKITNITDAQSLQAQGTLLNSIQSIILVCDDDGVSEICATSDLSSREGLVGNNDWDDIAHPASGGYRLYRDPSNFNIIFQTNNNYSGDNGPNLFFYISKVAHNPGVGNNDSRYTQATTSIVIDPTNPIPNNSGIITKPIPGSAMEDLADYKTMSLWCEAFSVLFNISEITDL